MNYFLRIFLMLYSMSASATGPQNTSCSEHCNSPFGALNGQSFLTKAYSNCSGVCEKNEDNFIFLTKGGKKLYTGMKWQCVEYARRWLMENKNVTFASVDYAYHIWDLTSVTKLDSNESIPLQHFRNKKTKIAPAVGDLLIYSKKLAVTGHVAVIVGIENDSITIAEQNYFNRIWEGKDYARRLLLDKNTNGYYRIIDEAVIGWLRV